MKKILTFLVMLVASVSFLMAQAPQAKFNYQAVVRDRINDDNLVMNQSVDVLVQIINFIDNQESVVYAEQHSAETNRNGMVSLIIGEGDVVSQADATTSDNVTPSLDNVDWGNAIIRATFSIGDQTLSVVENPVMAVPYALQANVDPLKITTEKIVEYISQADGTDVNDIFQAMIRNTEVSNVLRDSIVNYIKTQDSLVKELAIYFLSTVNKNDVRDALAAIDETVKDTIKDLIVEYLKSTEGKAKAYDVIATYLQTTTETEVENLITDAKSNPNAHEIAEMLYNRSLNYLKTHKQLVKDVAYYFVTTFVDSQDVVDFHNYIKVKRPDIYNYMLTKLNGYLQYYLNDVYHALTNCGNTNVCDLQNEINNLKAQVSHCPTISSATYVKASTGPVYTFTVNLTNADRLSINEGKLSPSYLNVKYNGTALLPTQNANIWWSVTNDGVATINYTDSAGSIAANPEFTIELVSCETTLTATATKAN